MNRRVGMADEEFATPQLAGDVEPHASGSHGSVQRRELQQLDVVSRVRHVHELRRARRAQRFWNELRERSDGTHRGHRGSCLFGGSLARTTDHALGGRGDADPQTNRGRHRRARVASDARRRNERRVLRKQSGLGSALQLRTRERVQSRVDGASGKNPARGRHDLAQLVRADLFVSHERAHRSDWYGRGEARAVLRLRRRVGAGRRAR